MLGYRGLVIGEERRCAPVLRIVEPGRSIRIIHRVAVFEAHLRVVRAVLLVHVVAAAGGARTEHVVQHRAEHRADHSSEHRAHERNRAENLSQNRTHQTAYHSAYTGSSLS